MESWTVLSAIVLGWVSQWVRGLLKVPTIVSYAVIVAFGFVLFVLGYEGAIAPSRAFIVDGLMWIASILGIGRVAADLKVAPKTNTI